MGTYCQEVNLEVVVADLPNTKSFTSPLLVEKTLDLGNKSQASNKQVQYTFDVEKTKKIFDFLVNEKLITFP